jgi:hypothetical protein
MSRADGMAAALERRWKAGEPRLSSAHGWCDASTALPMLGAGDERIVTWDALVRDNG